VSDGILNVVGKTDPGSTRIEQRLRIFLYREGAMCTEKAPEHDACTIQPNNDPCVEV
jgi:hypothetical protein